MCKMWGSDNDVAEDTFVWEIMLCWFINSYDILKDQAHIQGQAIKEEQLIVGISYRYALLAHDDKKSAHLCLVSDNLSASTS